MRGFLYGRGGDIFINIADNLQKNFVKIVDMVIFNVLLYKGCRWGNCALSAFAVC